MNSLEKMISVCKAYINDAFEIEEFQRQLEMIILPDECKYTLEKDQHNSVNKLEKIRFTFLPENQKKQAIPVAEHLIHEIRAFMHKE